MINNMKHRQVVSEPLGRKLQFFHIRSVLKKLQERQRPLVV